MGKFDKTSNKKKNGNVISRLMERRKDFGFEDLSAGIPFSVGRIRREATGLTQEQFAALYNIKISTLRNWERNPDSTPSHVRSYLHIIEKAPELALLLLTGTPQEVSIVLDKIDGEQSKIDK